ncbi:uncharacterized protein LOC101897016 [Musca domestica]|uniref:Uncharacterized protein LOC101897016 n=1 Tax=Musca domestica TaxID=7370 RepID=A0A9J7DIU0_MUSDO|nr:uncharacterized protein LOC101897016 [Musca domestica]
MGELPWIWIVCSISLVMGSYFDFIVDNDEIFEKCPDRPEAMGIHDIVDLSEFIIEFKEGYVSGRGQMTMHWKGVEATDRVYGYSELFKFQRGTWQPTTVLVHEFNFCKRQFDATTIWYNVWSRHIRREDQKCINNYEHVYHYEPFDVETVSYFPTNMEGLHKIVIHLDAYDKFNVRRANAEVCFQISGEFIKVK